MNGSEVGSVVRVKSEKSLKESGTVSPAANESVPASGKVSGPLNVAVSSNGSQASLGKLSSSSQPQPTDIRVGLVENTHRIDVEALMSKFRTILGTNWDRYRDALTQFLMGKLSRQELVNDLGASLGSEGLRMHNYLILSLLANACRELPPGIESGFGGWTKDSGKHGKRNGVHAAEGSIENLHREILTLSVRERRRIKSISREFAPTVGGPPSNQPKRPVVLPPAPCIISTRQAMLPHIPYVPDRDRQQHAEAQQQSQLEAQQQAAQAHAQQAQPKSKGRKRKADANSESPASTQGRQQSPQGPVGAITPTPGSQPAGTTVNESGTTIHPGRPSGPLTWTQDIIHGFDVPLSSESYELPGDDSIGTRMLGIALEHGLIEGIDAGSTDIMLVGLETYLQSTVQRMIGELRHRRITAKDPLGAKDMDLFVTQHPTELVDINAPLQRLKCEMLRDEATIRPSKRRAVNSVTSLLDIHNLEDSLSESGQVGPITPPLSHEDKSSMDFTMTIPEQNGSSKDQDAAKHTENSPPSESDIDVKHQLALATEKSLKEHQEGAQLIGSLLEF